MFSALIEQSLEYLVKLKERWAHHIQYISECSFGDVLDRTRRGSNGGAGTSWLNKRSVGGCAIDASEALRLQLRVKRS